LVGPSTGLVDLEKRKFLLLPGPELHLLSHPACSQSLHRPSSINNITPWRQYASKLYQPSDCCLSAKPVPTFADRGVPGGQRDGSLRPYSRSSRPETVFNMCSKFWNSTSKSITIVMQLIKCTTCLSPETRNNEQKQTSPQRSHEVMITTGSILEDGRRFTGVFLVHKNFWNV
jgi:hypothetical protein